MHHIKQNNLTDNNIKEILSFLPYFSETNNFKEAKNTENQMDKIEMEYFGIISPDTLYKNKISHFVKLLYDTNFIVDFAWAEWDEGRKIITNKELIAQSDLLTLRMLITAVVRNDRFCEGVLIDFIRDGKMKIILERLNDLHSSFYTL